MHSPELRGVDERCVSVTDARSVRPRFRTTQAPKEVVDALA